MPMESKETTERLRDNDAAVRRRVVRSRTNRTRTAGSAQGEGMFAGKGARTNVYMSSASRERTFSGATSESVGV